MYYAMYHGFSIDRILASHALSIVRNLPDAGAQPRGPALRALHPFHATGSLICFALFHAIHPPGPDSTDSVASDVRGIWVDVLRFNVIGNECFSRP